MKPQSGRNAVPHRAGGRVSSYPAGRVCEKAACATVLSRYNASPFCSVHEPRTRSTGARS